jgi:putative endonuclease
VAGQGESARERGRRAEEAVAAWLEGQGFEVLARNHATRRGEVDLVCREGPTVCFVEVRSRSRLDHGTPAESVTRAKARRVVDAATDWAARNGGLEQPARFDVVAVEWTPAGPRFTLYRAAFDAAGRSA